MQFRIFATLALGASLAAANGSPSGESNQCNTGSAQCCNSTGSASDPAIAKILSSVGVNAQDVTGIVGVTCSPITVVGTSGTSCSQQPVCCTNNSFNGVVAIGCTTINVNL
ncbi:hydrophobin-315 [Pholiota molesta]|nr:hydrophobin-315 [Pholiota molesta]